MFLTREKAVAYLAEQGVRVRGTGLKDHATRGTGPTYAIVNGRALYKREWLDNWVAAQAAKHMVLAGDPPRLIRGRRRKPLTADTAG